MTEEILAHMAKTANQPPFYYVQYMDVHYPYYPHPELAPDPLQRNPFSFITPWQRRETGKKPPRPIKWNTSFIATRVSSEHWTLL